MQTAAALPDNCPLETARNGDLLGAGLARNNFPVYGFLVLTTKN